MTEIDYWRQLDVFRPDAFRKEVHLIGAGATGSYVAWLLAKMGVRDLTVWDPDIIEGHNLPNQLYGLGDLDDGDGAQTPKVAALARAIKAATGAEIKTHHAAFTEGRLRGVVFLLTDSVESRKSIFESSIAGKKRIDLMVETRMAVDGGIVHAVRPGDAEDCKAFASTLFEKKDAVPSPCSARAISPTVAIVAGYAAHAVVTLASRKPVPYKTFIALNPPSVHAFDRTGRKCT